MYQIYLKKKNKKKFGGVNRYIITLFKKKYFDTFHEIRLLFAVRSQLFSEITEIPKAFHNRPLKNPNKAYLSSL